MEANKEQTFGDFIRMRREALGKTMRAFAAEVNITAAYLNDIEKGNRPAPEKRLDEFAQALNITGADLHEMYDLAGKDRNGSFADLNEYMLNRNVARVALRTARDYQIPDKQWEKFIEDIKHNKEGKKT